MFSKMWVVVSQVEHIRAAGFPAEEHHTQTADGYLIVLHRIPPPRPTPRVVVYLHGLFSSSLDLVLRGRDNGLGKQSNSSQVLEDDRVYQRVLATGPRALVLGSLTVFITIL